jgi:hypothetical protein
MGMLGGIRIPREPDEVSSPIEKRSPYPSLIRAGIIILPMAITVAGEDPDIAAKNIQAMTDAMARPPVNLPTKSFITPTSRSEIAPSAIILPARMKNGTPRSTKLSRPLKSCWIRDVTEMWAINMGYIAVVAARRRDMGMLSARRTKKQMRTIVSVIDYFFLTLSTGYRLTKPMKCSSASTRNLKAIILGKRGIGI